MKAVILAAGKGSRLGNLTDLTPKCMLPLNNKHTLLSLNFSMLKELKTIDSIILITGFEAHKLEVYAKKLSEFYHLPIEIVYNPFWNHCNVLGSFYMGFDKIDDDFIFMHADTLVEIDVLKALAITKKDICLAVDFKNCGEEEMKFWLEGGKIKRITKENLNTKANGEFVGVAKFEKKMIPYLKENTKKIFQDGNLNDYMEKVIDRGLINNELEIGYFDASYYKTIEVDFQKDYEAAKQLFGK